MSSVFPILGSVNLSGATSIIRKEHDYIQEHQIAGKDGGLVERVGSSSTRWEIKGMLRESGADGDYVSLKALLGTTSNLSIPFFSSGWNLCASGTNVFVESFQGNWMPGYGYPRYDYSLKLVATGKAPVTNNPILFSIVQKVSNSQAAAVGNSIVAIFGTSLTIGNTIVVVACGHGGTPAGGTFTNFTCSDGSNTYTKVKQNTDQGNNLGAVIFSAPITVGGTLTVTVTKSAGTVTNPGWIIEIYELQGLASSTATGSTETEGGSLPIATSLTGSLVVSSLNLNATGSPVVTFTGTIDNALQTPSQVIGHGTGSWDQTGGSITYVEELEASFA